MEEILGMEEKRRILNGVNKDKDNHTGGLE
jgi:hypothetical protein